MNRFIGRLTLNSSFRNNNSNSIYRSLSFYKVCSFSTSNNNDDNNISQEVYRIVTESNENSIGSKKKKKSILTGDLREPDQIKDLSFLNKHGLISKGFYKKNNINNSDNDNSKVKSNENQHDEEIIRLDEDGNNIIPQKKKKTKKSKEIMNQANDDVNNNSNNNIVEIDKDELNRPFNLDENGENIVVMHPSFSGGNGLEKLKSTSKKKSSRSSKSKVDIKEQQQEKQQEEIVQDKDDIVIILDKPKKTKSKKSKSNETTTNNTDKERIVEPLKESSTQTILIEDNKNIENYNKWLESYKDQLNEKNLKSTIELQDEPLNINQFNYLKNTLYQPRCWDHLVTSCNEQVFGNQSLRILQKEAINASLYNRDVFVSLPTGGGKSLCFQLPALLVDEGKVTLVISPLLALMQDQVNKLKSLGINTAALNSSILVSEKKRIMQELKQKDCSIRILYVTPERFANTEFLQLLSRLYEENRLQRLVIDEAHCISEWGHDFRPLYRRLSVFREMFGNVPISAFTATATPTVEQDIKKSLSMYNTINIRSSFLRPNLLYQIRDKSSDAQVTLNDMYQFIIKKYPQESGIIYCSTTKECEIISEYLSMRGVNCAFYHGALKNSLRTQLQKDWTGGLFKVVVTTIAFGMGIDKSDTRFVIHHTLPQSVESYYQQTGRAGRDGKFSDCLLYYSKADLIKLRKIMTMSNIKQQSTIDDYDSFEFDSDYNDQSLTKEASSSSHSSSAINFIQSKVEMLDTMASFCQNDTDCRRVSLLEYFGEQSKACKTMCDNCILPLGSNIKIKSQTNNAERVYKQYGSYGSLKNKKKKKNRFISNEDEDEE